MADNRCVAYVEPGKVEVRNIDYPKLELPEQNRKCDHGVILKIVATNICGSDQHMVRGRTTAPKGQTLGHEITGEVIELGRDVEFIKKGDLVSAPFNIACGRCRSIISIMRGYSPREAIRSWKRHTCPRTWCTQRSRDGEACVPKSPRKRHLPRRKPRGTCKVAVW